MFLRRLDVLAPIIILSACTTSADLSDRPSLQDSRSKKTVSASEQLKSQTPNTAASSGAASAARLNAPVSYRNTVDAPQVSQDYQATRSQFVSKKDCYGII